jgi:ABC-type multidrug transport system permease subunit
MDTPVHSKAQHNLDNFSTFFLVKAILTFAASLFFLLYAGMGLFFGAMMELAENVDKADLPPFNPGIVFIIIGVTGFVLAVIFGILTLHAGKCIKARKKPQFIFVMAILQCFTGVLGILLGVFTIIELQKPEVKALFEESDSSIN